MTTFSRHRTLLSSYNDLDSRANDCTPTSQDLSGKSSKSSKASSAELLHGLPKGLVITEIDKTAQQQQQPKPNLKPSVYISSSPANNGLPAAAAPHVPVLSIPEPPVLSSRSNGVRGHQVLPSSRAVGHPGMPNGLLSLASMQQQQQSAASAAAPKVATKVVPKDLKSQLALSKIGLPGDAQQQQQQQMLPPHMGKAGARLPPAISMSMAQTAAHAVANLKPVAPGKLKAKSPSSSKAKAASTSANGQRGASSSSAAKGLFGGPGGPSGSPGSSRSSSRNSSLSPRERSGSHSSNGSGGGKKAAGSASAAGAGAAPTKSALSPGPKAAPVKKKPNQPLVPWSKRNGGVQKNCNGWSWVGEGREEKVHLNVSLEIFRVI